MTKSLCAGVLLSVFIVHCGAISEYLVLSVYLPVNLFRDINIPVQFLSSYRPQTKLRKGNILQACVKNSVHGEGHLWQGVCMERGGDMCGRVVHGRGASVAGWSVHGRKDRHCSGQYASYWNAFLY